MQILLINFHINPHDAGVKYVYIFNAILELSGSFYFIRCWLSIMLLIAGLFEIKSPNLLAGKISIST